MGNVWLLTDNAEDEEIVCSSCVMHELIYSRFECWKFKLTIRLYAIGSLIKSEMIDNFTTARDLLKEIEYINANLGVHSYVNASNGTGTSAYNNVDFSAQLAAAQTSTATKAIGNSGIGAVYGNNATIDNSVVIKDNNFGYNVEEILTKVLDKNQKEMQAYILELFNNQ